MWTASSPFVTRCPPLLLPRVVDTACRNDKACFSRRDSRSRQPISTAIEELHGPRRSPPIQERRRRPMTRPAVVLTAVALIGAAPAGTAPHHTTPAGDRPARINRAGMTILPNGRLVTP